MLEFVDETSRCILRFVSCPQRCKHRSGDKRLLWPGEVRHSYRKGAAALSSGHAVCRTLQTLQLSKSFATYAKKQSAVTTLVKAQKLSNLCVSTWKHSLCSAGTCFSGAANCSATSYPTGVLCQKPLTASFLR